MKTATLLLVDDDRHILEAMADWLREQGFRVDTARSRTEALGHLDKRPYDVALVDFQLGDGDGFEILDYCTREHQETSVIMITGYGTAEMAMEATRRGAADFLTKPLIDEELLLAIERTLGQRRVLEENKILKAQLDERFGRKSIIGRDRRMTRIFDMIDAVADTKATILITGESGTGKSMIARSIHRQSSRRDKPFVEVACGALPENLLESELFGHVAGAFTGATVDKVGKFRQADGGTIFLDEIGTATPGLQVKLLRVLQEFEFEPVGGTQTFRTDARVILATNEDLAALVRAGKFRQDLYYRVNVINIEIPPLRERISDIPTLAGHFLQQVREETGKQTEGITDDALATLQHYSWPGNVRELQNVIERAVLLGKGPLITPDDFPTEITTGISSSFAAPSDRPLKEAMELPERQIILDVLERHNWNRNATAEALGVNRTTLYKKMKRLGVDDSCRVSRR